MNQSAVMHEVGPQEVMQLLDGELSEEREEKVAAHVRECSECSELTERLYENSARLANWRVQESGRAQQELERLRQLGNEHGLGWSVGRLLRPGYLAGLCTLLLALTFLAQMSPSRIHLQEPEIRAKLKKTESPNPKYPEEARRNGIQGEVRIHIVVGRDGSVKRLKVVSGDPILAKAAVEGVRKWKFEPTIADGKRVELEREVNIGFTLAP